MVLHVARKFDCVEPRVKDEVSRFKRRARLEIDGGLIACGQHARNEVSLVGKGEHPPRISFLDGSVSRGFPSPRARARVRLEFREFTRD